MKTQHQISTLARTKKVLRSTVVFILITGGLLFCSGCTIEAVNLNRQAQVYLDYNHYDQAEELLKKSLEIDFENAASHFWLAQCYEATGQTQKAIWEYQDAVRFNPSFELGQMFYIRALYRDGQEEKSLEATKLFIENKEAAARDFIRIAQEFLANKMDKHAIIAYHGAARSEPHNPVPFLAVSEYYFDKGNTDKGTDYLVRAFKVDPYYPGIARKLGEQGLRVDIPQPKMFHQPSEVEQRLFELEL
ncbi:MAG: tetratricopeptide repeat protein [Sedimentisphaerales bacterium]|nr:tetratricopeptide repeat protein [Sedimentisphaerales bacterium]